MRTVSDDRTVGQKWWARQQIMHYILVRLQTVPLSEKGLRWITVAAWKINLWYNKCIAALHPSVAKEKRSRKVFFGSVVARTDWSVNKDGEALRHSGSYISMVLIFCLSSVIAVLDRSEFRRCFKLQKLSAGLTSFSVTQEMFLLNTFFAGRFYFHVIIFPHQFPASFGLANHF